MRFCLGVSVLIVSLLYEIPAVTAEEGVPEGITLLRDLRYREGASQAWRLDLAMPKEKPAKARPAIVVIHGGGWLNGDKSSFSSPRRKQPGSIVRIR